MKAERTTVGRHEDNTFQIPAHSVSGHHAEITLRGNDIHVKDLGSTNGTYLNGEAVQETVVQPGQIIRFGMIEARLEASPPPGAPQKKVLDKTTVVPQGVKLSELDQGTQRVTFDPKTSPFQKKKNVAHKVFIGIAIVLAVGIIIVIVKLFKLFP